MGGESGESSGGSDDDFDNNQEYEYTGVENAPTERTIDSSDAPTGDKQALRLQQNMMAMIMMSMMGRNASGSVPNDGVMNMFAGISSTEQRNDGEGSNSNTQE
jgi:hypothetical protein